MSAKYEELRKLLAEIAATKKLRKEARAMWDANKGPWRVVQNRTHEIERMEIKLSELAAVSLPALLARLESLERLRDDIGNVLSESYSCFNCGYFGSQCGHDETENEMDDEACPICGCHQGDGFGMAENDPRYRDMIAALDTKGADDGNA